MKRWSIGGLVVLVAFILVGTALAHERIEQGGYAFVVGWLEEPPVVGLKNAASVEISLIADDSPVADAEADLNAQIAYGGQTRDLVLRPIEETPGLYAADFIPTRRGTYTFKLNGTLGDQPIDLSAEIEEVGSAASLEFPEAQPALSDVQQSIDGLSGELSSARLFGIAGIVLGALGLVLAAVALGRRRTPSA